MTETRTRWERILDKLGQKEEQALLIGAFIGGLPLVLATFGHEHAANLLREQWEPLVGVVATLIGPAFASNVARGKQRAQTLINAVRSVQTPPRTPTQTTAPPVQSVPSVAPSLTYHVPRDPQPTNDFSQEPPAGAAAPPAVDDRQGP